MATDACFVAITAWKAVGIAAGGLMMIAVLMWLWFILFGKGDWS